MGDVIGPKAVDQAGPAGAVTGVADAELVRFVADHYDRLLRLSWLVCRDETDAADAVQVALERAWRGRGSLNDQARLRPWLDRIVVREAIRAGKTRRSWLSRLTRLDPGESWIDLSQRAAAGAAPSAEWVAFRVGFQRLSADQRAVIVLHLHAGYSVAETAELVGAPVETVRSRLRLARERLRREVEEVRHEHAAG